MRRGNRSCRRPYHPAAATPSVAAAALRRRSVLWATLLLALLDPSRGDHDPDAAPAEAPAAAPDAKEPAEKGAGKEAAEEPPKKAAEGGGHGGGHGGGRGKGKKCCQCLGYGYQKDVEVGTGMHPHGGGEKWFVVDDSPIFECDTADDSGPCAPNERDTDGHLLLVWMMKDMPATQECSTYAHCMFETRFPKGGRTNEPEFWWPQLYIDCLKYSEHTDHASFSVYCGDEIHTSTTAYQAGKSSEVGPYLGLSRTCSGTVSERGKELHTHCCSCWTIDLVGGKEVFEVATASEKTGGHVCHKGMSPCGEDGEDNAIIAWQPVKEHLDDPAFKCKNKLNGCKEFYKKPNGLGGQIASVFGMDSRMLWYPRDLVDCLSGGHSSEFEIINGSVKVHCGQERFAEGDAAAIAPSKENDIHICQDLHPEEAVKKEDLEQKRDLDQELKDEMAENNGKKDDDSSDSEGDENNGEDSESEGESSDDKKGKKDK